MKNVLAIFLFLVFSTLFVQGQTISDGPLVFPEDGQTTYVLSSGQSADVIGTGSVTLKDGVHIQAGASFRARASSVDTPPADVTDPQLDFNMNWTLQRAFTYNQQGQRVEVSSQKTFFNDKGEALQSQSKLYTPNRIMAQQSVRDYLGRAALQTLPAPVKQGDTDVWAVTHKYQGKFAKVAGQERELNYADLDVPTGLNAEGAYTGLNADINLPLLDASKEGTLGWYYSGNNTSEAFTPESDYPYSRTEFYNEGSGEVRRLAMPGEAFRLGGGHESYGKGFPVGTAELKEYLTIRNTHVLPANPIASLAGEAVAQVGRDADGREAMSISDTDGNSLASFVMSPDKVYAQEAKEFFVGQRIYYANYDASILSSIDFLPIKATGSSFIQLIDRDDNTILYEGPAEEMVRPATTKDFIRFQIRSLEPFEWYLLFADGEGYKKQAVREPDFNTSYDFYVPFDGTSFIVTLYGGNQHTLLNLSGKVVEAENISGSKTYTLTRGYYRLQHVDRELINMPFYTNYQSGSSGCFKGSYNFPLTEASYSFYDAKGRLIASISPNGLKQLRDGASYGSIDKKTYEYSVKGELLAMQEPDAGRTEYMYARDGKLRFSQNAEQKKYDYFSYTHYDRLGRPVESGQYVGYWDDLNSLKFKSPELIALLETPAEGINWSDGYKTDWIKTAYNLPDAACPRAQQWVRGAVSYSENANSKTWYSYDNEGKVNWVVQHIKGLNKYVTLDYSYDFAGNVTQVAYQKEVAAEAFYHAYEYDADLRLSRVRAGRSTGSLALQATYLYYLHGPLKRVELADKLQGIDYVYTIQGWLKTMNHPDAVKDPGKDGSNGFAPDVFGMTLEYFSGDYTRTGTNIASVGVANPTYTGNIAAMHWRTEKPSIAGGGSETKGYQFTYDFQGQLLGAQWGEPNFSTNSFSGAGNKHKLAGLAYDANGNIKALQRYKGDGSLKHNFSYTYQYQSSATNPDGTPIAKNNQLNSIAGYSNYQYDALGQLRKEDALDARDDHFIRYDVSGKVIGVYSSASYNYTTKKWAYNEAYRKFSYTYDDKGFRLMKKDHASGIETWYVRDAGGQLLSLYTKQGTTLQQEEIPLYGSGRLGTFQVTNANFPYIYELKDHLGNVRATISRQKLGSGLADIRKYADYYPFGSLMRSAGDDYRYGYQGEFADDETEETGWNSFELRQYDAVVGRWNRTDPAEQYWSPYLGMGNSPINGVDPDGALFGKWRAKAWARKHGGSYYKDGVDGKWYAYAQTGQFAVMGASFGYQGLGISGQDVIDFGNGFANAVSSNHMLGYGRWDLDNASIQNGQFAGDLVSLGMGIFEAGAGVAFAGTGGAVTIGSLGTLSVVGVPAMALGGAIALEGSATAGTALGNVIEGVHHRYAKARSPHRIGARKHYSTRKAAYEAAKRAGKGAEPYLDGPHKPGQQPHYHRGDGKGGRLDGDHDHWYFPKRYY